MAYTYEDVSPTIIPNTIMQKRFLNGVHRSYVIAPAEGYVLHDKVADGVNLDPDTMEKTVVRRYGVGSASCGANYDFTPLTITDEDGNTFTTYGADREFFARLQSEVDADNIYGVGNNDHETI